MTSPSSQFGRFRSFLWPIRKSEYKKFIPMFFIFFLISFNYNILRAAKDTLIITAPNSGAETIPYIKTWIMLPAAILITYFFTKISNKLSRESVFYLMIGIFISFFLIFTFVLYPAREALHPSAFATKLQNHLPLGLHGLVALLRNWTFTLFYVASELWGIVILTVLFWGFANDVMSINEAKRFYSLFGVGANLASIFAGRTIMVLSKNIFKSKLFYGQTSWDQSVLFITSFVVIIGVLIAAIYYLLNRTLPEASPLKPPKTTTPKAKASLKKNFSYLMKSRYLIYIALIVLCYNITINLSEVIWKNQVKQLHPNSSDYNMYMGQVIYIMGILSTIIGLFISGNFLRKFNWTFNALIPPVIILITGMCFFSFFVLDKAFLTNITSLLGSTPLIMCVFFGTMQNCMARASKYTLFDATKEISFIPLDKEAKIKGKAAIDGVGSRIGKSGGAIIYQGMLLIFSTLAASAAYVGFIFLIFVVIWIIAVKALGKRFNILSQTQEIPEKAKAQEALLQETSLQDPLPTETSSPMPNPEE